MIYIDFVKNNAKCFKCKRPLKSGKAIIYNNHFYGPTCIESKNIEHKNIPDLTKGVLFRLNTEQSNKSKETNISITNEKTDSINTYYSYLIIRAEKLKDIEILHYSVIDDLYNKYKNGIFSKQDKIHLVNLVNKANTDNLKYSQDNIYFLYAIKTTLERLLENNPQNTFYRNLYKSLIFKATLSKPQFDALSKDINLNIKYYSYED